MIDIHFIVNPIAGKGKSLITETILKPFFIGSLHRLVIKHSAFKKHATQLTKDSIAEKADIIVACGGDGTINEVARCLVGSDIPLGIIPMGSGNGLASNLNIPKKIRKALEIIKNRYVIKIDVGQINNKPFFSNMGIGFDASVIKHYESSQKRTLYGYIGACLTSIKDIKKNKELSVSINETSSFVDPFIIMVSNSNEMGYNLSLTPKASLQDGLLDVLVISKLNRIKMLCLGVLILFRKVTWLREAKMFQISKLQLSTNDESYFETQIDGEFQKIDNGILNISICKSALNVLVAV